MTTPRYWLALYPDVSRPIGGAKQVHRLAEALSACGRDATLIQQNADFHPGWFSSVVSTISLSDWRQRKDLSPKRDVLILPETFLPDLLRDAPDLPRICSTRTLLTVDWGGSFPLRPRCSFVQIAPGTACCRFPAMKPCCLRVRSWSRSVSRLINAIETDLFRAGASASRWLMPRKKRGCGAVTALLQAQAWWNDSG